MNRQGRLSDQSGSLLATRGGILTCAAGCALFAVFRLGFPAALLLFAALLGGAARLWARYALRGVSLRVSAPSAPLSAGQTAETVFTVCNRKALPLLWLELDYAAGPDACVAPESGLEAAERGERGEDGEELRTPVWRRRFLFFSGWRQWEWTVRWRAVRRGVHPFDAALLCSGDGFGLTRCESRVPTEGERMLVVWPRLVDVNVSPLLQSVWSGETGRSGYAEDPFALRDVRDYQVGDPWKRIDWRLAARSGELQTRRYETVLPFSLRFVLDAASYGPGAALEEAVSLIASLLWELSRRGVPCTISLPAAPDAAVHPEPGEPDAAPEELLYRLAAFDAAAATRVFSERLAAAPRGERRWLFARSAAALSAPLLAGPLSVGNAALVLSEPEGAERLGCAVLPADALRGRRET